MRSSEEGGPTAAPAASSSQATPSRSIPAPALDPIGESMLVAHAVARGGAVSIRVRRPIRCPRPGAGNTTASPVVGSATIDGRGCLASPERGATTGSGRPGTARGWPVTAAFPAAPEAQPQHRSAKEVAPPRFEPARDLPGNFQILLPDLSTRFPVRAQNFPDLRGTEISAKTLEYRHDRRHAGTGGRRI